MNHPRKSNLDISNLSAVMKEVAEKDGVKLRKPALPTFNRPTAANVAAVQNESPAHSQAVDNGDDSSGEQLMQVASSVLSAPKVETEVISAEFEADINTIDPLPTNSRYDYTEAEIDKMLADLEREGKQLKAIELTPHDTIPGRYYAVDGMTRTLAMRKQGKATIRSVMVEIKDPWERYKASWHANNGARHTTDYDNGMRWRDMIDQSITTQPKITVSLAISEANVSRIMSVNKLPEAVRSLIRDHKFKLSWSFYYPAYQLYQGLSGEGMADEDRAQIVLTELQAVLDEDLSYREFSNRVDKHLKAKNANGATAADTSKVAQSNPVLYGGREVGEIKEWAVGEKLQISLKKVPVELRDQIKEAVRKILDSGIQAAGTVSSN